jgi:hypothetical protein
MAIWSILLPFHIFLPFGTFCCHFGIYFTFWHIAPRKSGNPASANPTVVSYNAGVAKI